MGPPPLLSDGHTDDSHIETERVREVAHDFRSRRLFPQRIDRRFGRL